MYMCAPIFLLSPHLSILDMSICLSIPDKSLYPSVLYTCLFHSYACISLYPYLSIQYPCVCLSYIHACNYVILLCRAFGCAILEPLILVCGGSLHSLPFRPSHEVWWKREQHHAVAVCLHPLSLWSMSALWQALGPTPSSACCPESKEGLTQAL